MGAALNVTINKYIYVMAHKTIGEGVRLKYDKVEHAKELVDVKHVLTRETFKYLFEDFPHSFEITSMSDVSYNGCGLGSSSAFTVGLIKVLAKSCDEERLANAACKVEIDYCKYPIGKQDQFAAAYGGMNLWRFYRDGTVNGSIVNYPDNMSDKFVLIYTGRSRDGNKILTTQSQSMITDPVKFNYVKRNRDRAFNAVDYIEKGDLDAVGYLLNESWTDKKKINDNISDPYFDSMYNAGIEAGALGGKMMGAGGGGFFLFYVPDYDKKASVVDAVSKITGHTQTNIRFTDIGSKVIYQEDWV